MDHKTGCLIIHGFCGNTSEIETLSRYLSDKGFITLCPVLKGHTGDRRALSRSNYKDWISSAEEGLKYLLKDCHKVVIIGFSMGGLIAADLALRYKVLGMVTLNTPIYYWDIARVFRNIINDLKSKNFSNVKRYKSSIFRTPFPALINFRILLQKARPKLRKVSCPIFIAQGLLDDAVRYQSADYIFKYTSSQRKTVKYYKNSNHLICLGTDSSQLFSDIENFLRDIEK